MQGAQIALGKSQRNPQPHQDKKTHQRHVLVENETRRDESYRPDHRAGHHLEQLVHEIPLACLAGQHGQETLAQQNKAGNFNNRPQCAHQKQIPLSHA